MPENITFVIIKTTNSQKPNCSVSNAKMKRDKNAGKYHWFETEVYTPVMILWTHVNYLHLRVMDVLMWLSYETVK